MTENNINNNSLVLSTGAKTGVVNTGEKASVGPSRLEVESYRKEINSSVDSDKFFDYYERRSWIIGDTPIRDWKAVFRGWDRSQFRKQEKPLKKYQIFHRYNDDPVREEDLIAFMKGASFAQ